MLPGMTFIINSGGKLPSALRTCASGKPFEMKTAGMIGGLGPESTALYYREIVAKYRKPTNDASYPSLFINSIDMKKVLALVTAARYAELAAFLSGEVQKLAAAGASFGFIAANAPHLVFDQVERQSPIPLISIVRTTCDEAKRMGLHRVGLIGARFTMQAKFYPEVFSQAGIEIVAPDGEQQEFIHSKYLGELVNGVIVPETRERLTRIMRQMVEHEGIEGVILGGTELPLILPEDTADGIPLLDTTKIHVGEIVRQMLG